MATELELVQDMDEVTEAARNQEQALSDHRVALHRLLEGVETAKQSFPKGSREERILTGAIAGWDGAARAVLGY